MSGVHDLNLENYVTGLNIETTWPIWCMSAGNYDRSSDNFEVNKMCNINIYMTLSNKNMGQPDFTSDLSHFCWTDSQNTQNMDN